MHGTGTFTRGLTRPLGALVVALLSALALSACGSSQNRSGADPAAIVPASVPVFVSLQVPDSGTLTQYRRIVTELAGAPAWTKLSGAFTRMLAKQKVSWSRDVEPWIGSQIGAAVVNLPAAAASGNSDNGVVLILPTHDIKDALAFERRIAASHPGEVARQDGDYMIVSNAATLDQFTSVGGPKLTADSSYTAVHTPIAGDQATVYGNLHGILNQLPSGQTTAGSAKLRAALAKLPADAAAGIGLTSTAKSISLDVIPHDLSSRAGSDATPGAATVANLPGDSIIAAAANLTLSQGFLASFNANFLTGFNSSLSRTAPGLVGSDAARRTSSRVLGMIDAVAPAFGPLSLAIGGNGLLGLHGGLVMKSANPAAAAKLLALVFSALKHSGSPAITGTARNFFFDEGAFKVHFALNSGQLLALLNEANPANLLSSSSPLSDQADYKAAAAQLPTGTTAVPFYLSFTKLDGLVGGLLSAQATSNPQDQQVAGVLKRLSYLIVGTAPSDLRIVLGLR